MSVAVPTTKHRTIAEKLEQKIAELARDRSERTPKQQAQAAAARYELHNTQRALDACKAIIDGLDCGDANADYFATKFNSAAKLLDAMKVGFNRVANGFHDIIIADDNKPINTSPEATNLRLFAYGGGNDEELEERNRKQLLAAKLASARNFNLPGFFPTADALVDRLIHGYVRNGMAVLEPSAGIGTIATKLVERGAEVVCVEMASSLVEILKLQNLDVIDSDFLDLTPTPIFDLVVMNPPFENGQDMKHIMHAFKFLKDDGLLRAICSAPVERVIEDGGRTKLHKEFHEWITDLNYECEPIEAGAFKNAFRSTNVASCLLHIYK
jgi:hypothetical protein